MSGGRAGRFGPGAVLGGRALASGDSTPYRPFSEAILSGLGTASLPTDEALQSRQYLGRRLPRDPFNVPLRVQQLQQAACRLPTRLLTASMRALRAVA